LLNKPNTFIIAKICQKVSLEKRYINCSLAFIKHHSEKVYFLKLTWFMNPLKIVSIMIAIIPVAQPAIYLTILSCKTDAQKLAEAIDFPERAKS
jgi:hypothetical protein